MSSKPQLKKLYQEKVVPKLKEKFGYGNDLAVPRIAKVIINVGVGQGLKEQGYVDKVAANIKKISGQTPIRTKAKKAIAGFKIRKDMVVGLKVTLRGDRMYDFVNKLVNIVFPRLRDFRGLSAKLDGFGNFTFGFQENMSFPEIKAEEMELAHGLEVTITTTAKNDREGLALLKALGFPFKQEETKENDK